MYFKVVLVLTILGVATTNISGLEVDEIKQARSLLQTAGIDIEQIIHNTGINVDQKLTKLFPKLKSKN